MRKPKGFHHRYEIIYRLTELNNGEKKFRWHVVKYHGMKEGAASWGYINPCPGSEATNEQLIARAGYLVAYTSRFLDDVIVPIYIIRNGIEADRMKAGLLEPAQTPKGEKS